MPQNVIILSTHTRLKFKKDSNLEKHKFKKVCQWDLKKIREVVRKSLYFDMVYFLFLTILSYCACVSTSRYIKFSSTIFAILYYLTFASANVFKKRATYILLEDKIGWPMYILEAVFLVPKSRVDYRVREDRS